MLNDEFPTVEEMIDHLLDEDKDFFDRLDEGLLPSFDHVVIFTEALFLAGNLAKARNLISFWEEKNTELSKTLKYCYLITKLLFEEKKHDKAMDLLEKSHEEPLEELGPLLILMVNLKGRILFFSGQQAESLKVLEPFYDHVCSIPRRDRYASFAVVEYLKTYGSVLRSVDKTSKSESTFQLALNIAEDFHLVRLVGLVLNNFANLYRDIGSNNNAISYYKRSIMMYKRCKWPTPTNIAYSNLGTVYVNIGQFNDAEKIFKRILATENGEDDITSLYLAYANLMRINHRLGLMNKTMFYQKKTLEVVKKLNMPFVEATQIMNLAVLLQEMGDLKQAEQYYHQSLKVIKDYPSSVFLGMVTNNLANLYSLIGENGKARIYYKKAFHLFINNRTDPTYLAALICDVIRTDNFFDNKGQDELLALVSKENASTPVIDAYIEIIEGITCQRLENNHKATKHYEKALTFINLEPTYKTLCYEKLLLLAISDIQKGLVSVNSSVLPSRLMAFEDLCIRESLSPSLCNVYLIRSKLASYEHNYQEALVVLDECIKEAKKKGLPLHLRLAMDEKSKIEHRIMTKFEEGEDEKESLSQLASYIEELNKTLSELKEG